MQRNLEKLPLTYQQARDLKKEMSSDQKHCEALLDATCRFITATEECNQEHRAKFFGKESNERIFNEIGEALTAFDNTNKTDQQSTDIRAYCVRLIKHRLEELKKSKDTLSHVYQEVDNPLKARLGK